MPSKLCVTLLILTISLISSWNVESLGVNWGTSASHPLPPTNVVQLLKSNKIRKVKLFDADPNVLQSLSDSGIDVTVGIPNSMLKSLSSNKKVAHTWVHDNLTRYFSNGDRTVRIEYIAVGDEPFLESYGKEFQPFVIGATTNLQTALTKAKLENKVKIVVPCHSDAFLSPSGLPSKGHFRPDLNKTMIQLLTFLTKHNSPFFVNINPFSSIHQNKNKNTSSLDFALFKPTAHSRNDGRRTYKNTFDFTLDTLVSALSKSGFPDMDIVVGQIGWPTDGSLHASSSIAQTFMKGLVNNLQSGLGTPLRPKKPPAETYIFSLLDENRRAGNFERHWGLFTFDGQAKYYVDFGQGSSTKLMNAENVDYLPSKWCVVNNNKDVSNVSADVACSGADCTALAPGGSCFNISWPGNVSYAFNSYYQMHDQKTESCDFNGFGLITTVDPSVGDCRFPVEIRTSTSTGLHWDLLLWWRFLFLLGFLI